MTDTSFTFGRVKIVGEAKDERVEETDEQRRRKIFGRIRIAIPLLMLATILVFAYCCRAELQFLFFSKPATQTSNGTSATLKTAQNNTAARDKVVNEVTK